MSRGAARAFALAGLIALAAPGSPRAQTAAVSGSAAQGSAQKAPPISPSVQRITDEVEVLRQERKYADALTKADEAYVEAERVGDRFGAAFSLFLKGIVIEGADDMKAAHAAFEKSLAAFEAINEKRGTARSYSGLSRTEIVLGDRAVGKAHANEALRIYREIGDDLAVAVTLRNLLATEDSPAAMSAITNELLAIANRLGDAGLRGTALEALGNRQFTAGDLAAAKTSYDAAIAAFEEAHDVNSVGVTNLALGRVFRAHGDYQGAIDHYDKAITLFESINGQLNLIEAINARAVALGFLERNQESIAAYERGLSLARASGNPRYIDFMMGNLAGGYLGNRDWARAVPLLEEVLRKKPEPYLAAFRENQLAAALAELDRVPEALEHANEAIRISRELKVTEPLHTRLDTRAWVFEKLGRLDEALADAREALAIVEQIRATLVPTDFLKRGYGETVAAYYSRAVDLLARLDRAGEALEMAEQGRARAFLDLLASRETDPGETMLATRGEANAQSPVIRSDASATPLPASGIVEVAARLRSTIVEYWVGDDATIIWTIGPAGTTRATRVSVGRKRLEELVAATTAAFRDVPDRRGESIDDDLTAVPLRGLSLLRLANDTRDSWRELSRLLIDPIRTQLAKNGSRVTIVPHGPLFQLSFAALPTAAGRYLIEDYELNYAPAASVLAFTGRRQIDVRTGEPGPWLLIGNPETLPEVGKAPLPPLPGAARELTSIAAIGAGRKVIQLTGGEATEAVLASTVRTEHPSVLHFATHGFVPGDPAALPFLALQHAGDGAASDGRLTTTEVYGLTLSSDLVVLSACRSGSGRVSADGMIGLTRAFFAAGTPSVVATFWDVTDEATSALMTRFYREYAASQLKGASLRDAQLSLLRDLRAGRLSVTASGRRITLPEHPLLWAAFFLSGEP